MLTNTETEDGRTYGHTWEDSCILNDVLDASQYLARHFLQFPCMLSGCLAIRLLSPWSTNYQHHMKTRASASGLELPVVRVRMRRAPAAPRGWHTAVLPDSLTPHLPSLAGTERRELGTPPRSSRSRRPPSKRPRPPAMAPSPPPAPAAVHAGSRPPGAPPAGRAVHAGSTPPPREARCTPGGERRPARWARYLAAAAATSHTPVRPSAAPCRYLKSWAVSLAAIASVKWRRDLVTDGLGDGTPTPSGRVMARVARLTPRGGGEWGYRPLPAP